jgi:hypothetical protein
MENEAHTQQKLARTLPIRHHQCIKIVIGIRTHQIREIYRDIDKRDSYDIVLVANSVDGRVTCQK